MNFLASADLHLTGRPQDEYRWTVLPWLRKRARLLSVDCVVLLGDLTNAKDEHPASLVNRLTDELSAFPCPVHNLMGNHDYSDPADPFFRFLRHVPNLRFIDKPLSETLHGKRVRWMPHRHRWQGYYTHASGPRQGQFVDFSGHDLLFFHQAVHGAGGSNGVKVRGVPRQALSSVREYAVGGDVHVPQRLGKAYYCGAPHPVNFGDEYAPSVLHYRDGALRRLPRASIRKASLTLSKPKQILTEGLTGGDMVKVTVRLPREDFHTWGKVQEGVRGACKDLGVRLCSLTLEERGRKRLLSRRGVHRAEKVLPQDHAALLRRFAAERGLGEEETLAGLSILDGV